jgi:hypothetical protein
LFRTSLARNDAVPGLFVQRLVNGSTRKLHVTSLVAIPMLAITAICFAAFPIEAR